MQWQPTNCVNQPTARQDFGAHILAGKGRITFLVTRWLIFKWNLMNELPWNWIKTLKFSLTKTFVTISSARCRAFCSGFDVLNSLCWSGRIAMSISSHFRLSGTHRYLVSSSIPSAITANLYCRWRQSNVFPVHFFSLGFISNGNIPWWIFITELSFTSRRQGSLIEKWMYGKS